MAESAGFQEIVPDLPCSTDWKTVTVNTGAFQSTLQDIKVPEYGSGYVYRGHSPATFNRYIFWRVTDDCVELWEQSLDIDLTHNHVFLRIVGLPILEGISIHEDEGKRVIILVATIASTHSFCLPHPDTLHQSGDGQTRPSILRDLDQHTLRDLHTVHLLSAPAVEGGRAHTACSALVGDTALFLFAQPDAGLLLLSMPATGVSSSGAVAAKVTLIKKSSLVNRLLMGFVPGMFRGDDGGITSLCCAVVSGTTQPQQGFALGVCGDGRLRMWCLQRCECVLLHDTLEDTAEAATRSTAAGRHRVVCRMTGPREAMVAVLLSFAEKQLLLLYGLALPPAGADQTPPSLSHVKTLYPPQYHLVDMSLTSSHLWTLWSDTNNENQVLYSSVGPSSVGFTAAVLQAGPEGRVPVSDSGLSPRELYTQQLFSPYRFTRPTLARALAIYRSDGGTTAGASSTGGGGVAALQEEVEAVLQVAVQAKLPPHAEPQQLYEATLDTWEEFYSQALQYHQVGQKPLGLACGGCGAVVLVRRQSVAWLGEMEPVDAVVAAALAAQNTQGLTQVVARVGGGALLRGDGSAAASVAGVLRCVAAVRRLVDADVAAAFLLDMAHHRHPEQVAEDMAASLLGQVVGGDEVSSVISNVVCTVPNFTGGLRLLVQALNFDGTTAASPSSSATPSNEPRRGQLWCSLVSASLHQLASSRLLLCRDVLVLQQMALQLAHLCQLSPDSVGQLRTSLVQDTVLLSRAFHAFLCLSRAPAAAPSAAHLHAVSRVAAALGVAAGAPPLQRLPHTALCAALCQGAGPHVSSPGAVWARDGLEAVRAVAREAWPLQDRRGSTALLEALVFGGQSEAALHYIRQVCGWCEWSLCSRHFLLGVCLLLQGQARKAARFLHEAGEGCGAEELLGERVGGGGDSARLNYTLRLVRLFELFQQPSLALRLANNALCVAQDSAQHTAQLYAVLFKHHLALHHHDEAFTALQANPDSGPQRACLRQLLVALHTRGHLDTLVKYEYGKLTSEVITILENRARSADILVNNYYHLLYAFHVRKHNYKRAASVMYECASRLSTEAVGERGLKQQLKCYLAAINCLKLLPPDMAWILKPGPAMPAEGEAAPLAVAPEGSSKRCVGGSRVCRRAAPPSRRTVDVLELCHLQREYRLLHARLTLAAVTGTHDTSGTVTDASSTVSLLCHGQLYREAAGVCRLFSLSLSPVVQSLAAACVAADLSSDRQQQTAWLRHNDVTTPTGWWELLRWLVCEEGRDSSELLQCTAEAVLERDHHLPPWLLSTYTLRDCSGLLRALLRYGRLEAAATLALQLLDALTTGHCAGQFGLESAVHITSPPVCLPYTALDHLLLELNHNKHQLYYDKVLTQLQQKLQLYQTEVARVSRDRVLLQR